MLYATTATGKVCITDYQPEVHGPPRCPCCECSMFVKRGSIIAHHFAHASTKNCEHWTEPMTKWHLNWQLLAQPEWREVRMKKDDMLHIADLQLPDGHVIEIQHSVMSAKEVSAREAFYDDMTWIVDGTDIFRIDGMYHDIVVGNVTQSKTWWGNTTKPIIVDTVCGLVALKDYNRGVKKGDVWSGQIVNQENVPRTVYTWLQSVHPIRNSTKVRPLAIYRQFSAVSGCYEYSFWHSETCLCDNYTARTALWDAHKKNTYTTIPDYCPPYNCRLTPSQCEEKKRELLLDPFEPDNEVVECSDCQDCPGCIHYTLINSSSN